MATKRIKDISTTATTFAADDFIALDASSVGTRKMAKASLITQVGANYLEKADNLSDVASKDTSKLNLEVPNVGTAANEVSVNGMLGDLAFQSSAGVVVDDLTVDGQLTAAVGKPMPVNGPTMRFDGSDDEVSFAATTDSPFSFTSGTDDTPFAITCWVKMTDATSFVVVSKQQSAREYVFRTDSVDKLRLNLSDGTNIPETEVNAALTEYENQWVHLCVTYSGAGPNSSRAFSDAASGIQFYINAKLVATTATNKASYSGMNASSDQVRIGKQSTAFADGEIRDVKIFNKELSSAEVKEVFSNGQLPESFAESTGSAEVVTNGGFENWHTSTDLIGWTERPNITVQQEATDKITGSYSCRLNGAGTLGSTSGNWLEQSTVVGKGKKCRFTGKFKKVSGSGDLQVGIRYGAFLIFNGSTFSTWVASGFTSGTEIISQKSLGNGWYSVVVDFVNESSLADLAIGAASGVPYLIDDVSLVQIGSVLDARAEQFDTSTGKLYDLSGNDFVGTQSGGVSLLGREFPVYETGTWNGVYSPATGTFATMTMDTSLVYTRIGNLVTVTGFLQTDNVDITGGSGQLQITGLPFAASVVSTCQVGFAWNWGSSFPLSGYIVGSSIRLLTRTSTTARTDNFDVGGMSTGALANRNTMYISATYQIS